MTRPSGATVRTDRRRVVAYLRQNGYLLLSDPAWTSAISILTGRPTRGSLWSHPAVHRLFQLSESLDHAGTILPVKLLAGKTTWVHRSRWPELVSAVDGRDVEQLRGLTGTARELWDRVRAEGTVRMDEEPPVPTWEGVSRSAARDLERRLLVLSSSEHTETGQHELRLTSWDRFRRDHQLGTGARSFARSRSRISEAVLQALGDPASLRMLPWDPSGRWRSSRGGPGRSADSR